MAERFVEAGGIIYEQTPIQTIQPDEITGLEARNGAYIHAKKIIIASHFLLFFGLGLYFARLQMKRNYVFSLLNYQNSAENFSLVLNHLLLQEHVLHMHMTLGFFSNIFTNTIHILTKWRLLIFQFGC